MSARAPYNFIPLPDKVMAVQPDSNMPDHDRYHKDLLSGYFDVELTTESPLYIRGPFEVKSVRKTNETGSKNTTTDFFHHGDSSQPVIPGSSLRGMLRGLLEIITWGKMTRVSDSPKIFFRAVAAKNDDPLGEDYKKIVGQMGRHIRAGYLHREGETWYIQPAEKIDDQWFLRVKDTPEIRKSVRELISLTSPDYHVQYHSVCFDKNGKNVRSPGNGEKPSGMLVCTGNMAESGRRGNTVNTKRKRFVLIGAPQNQRLQIDPQAVKDYCDSLTAFQKDPKNGFDEKLGFLKEGRPVFYIQSGQGGHIRLFGHNPFFRIPATIRDNNKERAITPLDCVPKELRDPNTFDWADALFGHVQQDKANDQGNKRQSYAGRVFVEDAFLAPGQTDLFEKEVTLRILSSPKPTTFQHYLEQPQGKDTEKSNLSHYAKSNVKIRGHKLYWRQRGTIEQAREEGQVSEGDTQHTCVKAVKAGKTFKFRVRFENLTHAELGALAWAIALPSTENKELRHMLGMGKPLGMGVVKLTPTLYLIDRQTRYRSLFNGDGWEQGVKEEATDFYVKAFYAHVKQTLDFDFLNHERVKELLVMLQARAYDENKFGYMKIEPNEFKDRPVLPRPSEVVEELAAAQPQNTPKPKLRSDVFDVEEGDVLRGKVLSMYDECIFVAIPEDKDGKFEFIIHEEDLGGRQYKEANPITVKVLRVNRSRDPIEVTCRPARKEEKEKKNKR